MPLHVAVQMRRAHRATTVSETDHAVADPPSGGVGSSEPNAVRRGDEVGRHARAPIAAFAGEVAMKYSAPLLPDGHALEAHKLGLRLQTAAQSLDHAHSHDYRLSRHINRMQHAVWFLIFLAALLVVITWAPLDDWWRAITDVAYGNTDTAR